MTIYTRGLYHSDSMQLVDSLLPTRVVNVRSIRVIVESSEKIEFMRHVFEILTNYEAVIRSAL